MRNLDSNDIWLIVALLTNTLVSVTIIYWLVYLLLRQV